MNQAPVFVDTSQYVAFLHEGDELHDRAVEIADLLSDARLVTTEAVVVELFNFFSGFGPRYRRLAADLVDILRSEPALRIDPQTTELLEEGIDLYRRREDKSYSLTDCMSMVTCRRLGVTQVATSDRDFVQEGFIALLA
jgi:predicted nucleic acid-binding protein